MKQSAWIFSAALLLLSLGACATTNDDFDAPAAPARASSRFDSSELSLVTIVNNTGGTIFNVYLSPGDASVWGPDLLDSDQVLSNGDSYSFNVLFSGASAAFDLMLVDSSKRGYSRMGVTLSKTGTNRFTFTSADRGSEVDLGLVTVTLRNTLSHDLYYLFLSPSESQHWGADLLASDKVLSAGESLRFYVPVTSTTRYNFLGVDEDRDSYRFDLTLEPGEDGSWAVEYSDMQ